MEDGEPAVLPQASETERENYSPDTENVVPASTDEGPSTIDAAEPPTDSKDTQPVVEGESEGSTNGLLQDQGGGADEQSTQEGQEPVEPEQPNEGEPQIVVPEGDVDEPDRTIDGETTGEGVAEGDGPADGAAGEPDTIEGVPTSADGADNPPAEESTAKGAGEEGSSPIPDSGTFQDGERPETPTVQVPEPLSREGSPKQEPEHLDAGTPEAEESPRAGDVMGDVEEEEEPLFSREELVEAYQAALAEREQLQNHIKQLQHKLTELPRFSDEIYPEAALAEREQLQNHNTQLQHKLAEYFKKKKSDDQRQEMDKNVTDQEQRYLKYMSNLEELRNQEEDERESFHHQLEELKERKQERLEMVKQEHDNFTDMKKTVASEAISSRTGKPVMPREVEMYIGNELKKEEEVKVVRLENIKLKNRLKKREQQLKAKEELAEGLHLIDFEQLKIENQTYNEKIEERNEELLKFRKKITSTVQVLTHVKEKLQFVQAENQVQKAALREVEAHVALKRDLLSRTKKARDSLRIDNQRLRQRCGLLGNEVLLQDFEERKDEGEELRSKLDLLKRQHAELVLKSAGVKKKIDETRS